MIEKDTEGEAPLLTNTGPDKEAALFQKILLIKLGEMVPMVTGPASFTL